MKKYFIALICTLLLSACGFHLRGMAVAPKWLSNVAIMSPMENTEMVARLKSQLESYKIYVNPNPEHASYWLVLNQEAFQQKIISVGASTNSRQYQLTLLVSFTVQTKTGKIILPEQQVQVTRQFTANNNRILGSDYEESLITKEMRQEAASQVIKRISAQNYYAN